MSEKKRLTYKPFSVKHLLQKDGEVGEKDKDVERFETDNRRKDNDGGSTVTQAPIFNTTNVSKHSRNTQALNLAERLAGNLFCCQHIFLCENGFREYFSGWGESFRHAKHEININAIFDTQ